MANLTTSWNENVGSCLATSSFANVAGAGERIGFEDGSFKKKIKSRIAGIRPTWSKKIENSGGPSHTVEKSRIAAAHPGLFEKIENGACQLQYRLGTGGEHHRCTGKRH